MESESLFKEEPDLAEEEEEEDLIPLASFRKIKGKRKSGQQSQVKEVIMKTPITIYYLRMIKKMKKEFHNRM